MEIFEKNIEINENLKKTFLSTKDPFYEVEWNKNNLPILRLNNIYLHSKYDPIKEAERSVDLILSKNEDFDIIIIYGCGLCYILRELFQRIIKNNKKSIKPYIVYIEKDIRIFFTTLKYFDMQEILTNPNVKVFIDSEKEVIGSFIQSVPTKIVKYYYHRPTYFIYMNYYKELQNHITYVLDRKDMNSATFKRFQRLWTKNCIRNLPLALMANPLNSLTNIALNGNAIVVAGGPTVEKSLSYLKENQNNSIIIAVDTVYKYLIRNGIKVDIITTIDPQYLNYKYLEDVKLRDEIIVTDSSTYYKIFHLSSPSRYFLGNSIFPVTNYFIKEDRGNLGAGGSVATVAFDVSRIIGAKNIILIGLDLSYPERKTHFRGAFFESNFITTATYFKPTEDSVYKYLTHASPLLFKESTNEMVWTDAKMIIFKKWFDREIGITNGSVYQPDLGGIKIEGTIIKKLSELPSGDKSIKENFIKNINDIVSRKRDFNKEEIIKNIENFIKISEEIKKSYQKIVNLIDDNGNVNKGDIPIIEEEERNINQNENKYLISRILASSAQDILIMINENYSLNNDEKKSAWIKTKMLYSAIIDFQKFYYKNFNKLLRIIKNNPNIFLE